MALPRRRPRDPEGRMPLGEHLRELRQRIVKSGITLLIATAFGWFVYDPVIEDLLKPYKDYEAAHPDKVVTTAYSGLTSAFSQHLSIAIFLGVLISSPVWLYQIWAFITPGLYKKERRFAGTFVVSAKGEILFSLSEEEGQPVWRQPWRRVASALCWWIWTPRAMPPWVAVSTSVI